MSGAKKSESLHGTPFLHVGTEIVSFCLGYFFFFFKEERALVQLSLFCRRVHLAAVLRSDGGLTFSVDCPLVVATFSYRVTISNDTAFLLLLQVNDGLTSRLHSCSISVVPVVPSAELLHLSHRLLSQHA